MSEQALNIKESCPAGRPLMILLHTQFSSSSSIESRAFFWTWSDCNLSDHFFLSSSDNINFASFACCLDVLLVGRSRYCFVLLEICCRFKKASSLMMALSSMVVSSVEDFRLDK